MSIDHQIDSQIPNPNVSRTFRRPVWLWVPVGFLVPSVCMAALVTVIPNLADGYFVMGFWLVAAFVYPAGVLFLFVSVLVWLWLRHKDKPPKRGDLFNLLVGLSFLFLWIVAAAFAWVDAGEVWYEMAENWFVAGMILNAFGLLFYVPSAAIFAAIVLR